MLHIENIDAYSIRFGSHYGGGTHSKVLPKTLEARRDEIDRIWISHTDRSESVLNCAEVSNITLDGVVYTTGEEFVVAFNALMASSTPYTTTTTTAAVTTTTTTV
jgi:hypothetical protein